MLRIKIESVVALHIPADTERAFAHFFVFAFNKVAAYRHFIIGVLHTQPVTIEQILFFPFSIGHHFGAYVVSAHIQCAAVQR